MSILACVRYSARFLLTAVLVGVTVPMVGAGARDEKSALSAEELASLHEFGPAPVALSPDGNWLAYTVQDWQRASEGNACLNDNKCGGEDVWVANTKTGQSESITDGGGTSWGPAWSPDGKKIAFFSDQQGQLRVWTWTVGSRQLLRVPGLSIRAFARWETPVWTRDSKGLVVRIAPRSDLNQANTGAEYADSRSASSKEPHVLVFDSPKVSGPGPNTEFDLTHSSDLAVLEVASGHVRRIAESLLVGAYKVSPDGKSVAFTSETPAFVSASTWRHWWKLSWVPLAGGPDRVLADDIQQEQPFGTWFSWSPDSAHIAYTDIGSQDFKNVDKKSGDLHVVSIRDGSRWTTEGLRHPSFGDDRRPPYWNPQGTAIYVIADGALWRVGVHNRSVEEVLSIPGKKILEILSSQKDGTYSSSDDGKSMLVLTRDQETKQEGSYRVDVQTGRTVLLRETEESIGYPPSQTTAVSENGTTVVYMAEAVDRYSNFWVTDRSFQSPVLVTHINPQLDSREFGKSMTISWRSPAGDLLHGALLLPTHFSHADRYPLVVDVYGGVSPSESVHRFGIDVDMRPEGIGQFLATRGYAVFRPDSILHAGSPMRDIAECVLSGVDRVVELGIADPERLGVIGHSYGGYSVLSLIVQTNRFKAAVVNQGMGDLINFCNRISAEGNSWSSVCEDGQERMGTTLWEGRERYINNSPVFFLDKVQTPLLFANGAKDQWSTPSAAEEIFGGLERLGKTVKYVKYLDEEHNFTLYQDNVDFLLRMEAWFGRYLDPVVKQHAN